MRTGNRAAVGAGLVGVLAGIASAGTFSFAADANQDGPVLQGGPTTANTSFVRDGATQNSDGSVQIDFRWDPDEDGPLGPLVIPSRLVLQAESKIYTKTNFAGMWIHSYTFGGSYEFRRLSDDAVVFSATFSNALWTSVSSSEFAWGQTATLQSSDTTDGGITFLAGPALPALDLSQSEDFAFTLTNLTSLGGGAVGINASGAPLAFWKSEASWSAQAIPAPGAVVLTMVGGLVAGRRRR